MIHNNAFPKLGLPQDCNASDPGLLGRPKPDTVSLFDRVVKKNEQGHRKVEGALSLPYSSLGEMEG